MANESLNWPSFATFALVWIALSLITWGLVCLPAVVFMHGILHAGLVPAAILLPLALIPISVLTFTVQTVLFLVGRNVFPGNLKAVKQLLLLGTPVVTWICLAAIVWIMGGPDTFVPRL